ncbi:hypothetical protein M446_4077 [Methylobacterium sp. 4-46]|uniref:hypothetical protein n=1 Tax=unclassified Methylobacterium TaxID=2615210 RepID=UPI000152E469|nr:MULTISPECIES: hypothetical protein [Methylobacterium]ACA18435.1 hypothetical protein M446_4077 [Methylobacterium sp. 4-46]WFT77727.1 hypothetical protein QA634_20725 [Methylobacterium nodulans]
MAIPVDVALVRGDVILVRAVVGYGHPAGSRDPILARVEGGHADVIVDRSAADLAETKLAIGDEVAVPDFIHDRRGIVRAIDGDEVWVRWTDNGGATASLVESRRMLERTRTREQVEADEPRPVEAAPGSQAAE